MRPARLALHTASEASRPASRPTFAPGRSNRSPSSVIGSAFQALSGGSLRGRMRRIAAALIALICWLGIGLQFWASYSFRHYDLLLTLWTLARFFTIISNLALAIVMTLVAAGKRVSPLLLGGLTLAILLVGIVYRTLLAGLHPLSGLPLAANILLHDISPIAMTGYWLLFVPRGRLRWSAPW